MSGRAPVHASELSNTSWLVDEQIYKYFARIGMIWLNLPDFEVMKWQSQVHWVAPRRHFVDFRSQLCRGILSSIFRRFQQKSCWFHLIWVIHKQAQRTLFTFESLLSMKNWSFRIRVPAISEDNDNLDKNYQTSRTYQIFLSRSNRIASPSHSQVKTTAG